MLSWEYNKEEFKKYVDINLTCLYPGAADVAGSREILKVDSRTGWTNHKVLARLRLLGYYLYLCIQNSTTMSYEIDQLYGLFKLIFHDSLRQLTDDRLEIEASISFNSSVIGLLVFGGIDNVTGGVNTYKYAYATTIAFSTERNLSAWAPAFGAA